MAQGANKIEKNKNKNKAVWLRGNMGRELNIRAVKQQSEKRNKKKKPEKLATLATKTANEDFTLPNFAT